MASSANSTNALVAQGPVSCAVTSMRSEPEPPPARREFLRTLTMLPMVGGAVTLIGTPTAVAEPVTPILMRTYASWLHGERVRVLNELYPSVPPGLRGVEVSNPGFWFHHNVPDYQNPPPSSRAALVLSTVGCDWW